MSVYKDEQRGTWYCMFRYNDWTGRQKQKCKEVSKQKEKQKSMRNNLCKQQKQT